MLLKFRCFYLYNHNLLHIQKSSLYGLNRDVMKQLVSVLILSRIDYCNSVLVGLPWSTIAPLHRVQNAAARLVMGLSARDHVRPALRELHWLPLAHRIKFKVALLMYMAHNRLSLSLIHI